MGDYGDVGPSVGTLVLAAFLVLLLIGMWVAWMQQPPPKPPAPPPAAPKAPQPPPGCSDQTAAWLDTMRSQLKTLVVPNYLRPGSNEAIDAVMDPGVAHIMKMLKDYEKNVEKYSEKCRKMIEEPKK